MIAILIPTTSSPTTTIMGDPNFPNGLDIKPLHVGSEFDNDFDYDAQQEAIQTYGIAGRVW